MSDVDWSVGLGDLLDPGTAPPPDNADPHPLVLVVHPRQVVDGVEHEADFEVEVGHPSTCSQFVEECPVADLLDIDGIGRDFYAGFPEPDDFTDEDLAVLNGTVRFVTVSRTYSHLSNPSSGDDWGVEFDFVWSDE